MEARRTVASQRVKAVGVHGPEDTVLAICGGGNAGHALAILASLSFSGDILWLTSSPEKAERLRAGVFSPEGLRSTGVVSGRADRVRVISSDPAEIIPPADLVMIVVPAFAHSSVLSRISPYLKVNAVVGVLPARSGFEFATARAISGIHADTGRTIFGLQTLPWPTRIQQTGRMVRIITVKAEVLMAALPHRQADGLAPRVSALLGTRIVPTSNFLNLTLGNPGQIIHPGIMYGLFANWSGRPYREQDIPRFYADASDETGALVAQLSDEIMTVAREVEAESRGALDLSGVLPIHDWLRISYPTQIGDASTVATCFRTLMPLQVRKPPMREAAPGEFVPDFTYRYLSEDVPFGLAVVRAIAELGNLDTPGIDAVISWTQEKLGKRYLDGGRLNGADVGELRIPQNYDIRTLGALVAWYLEWS